MPSKSILLGVNGSAHTVTAAEVCWELAQRWAAEVTAQHVVDSNAVWDFLGHEMPGFIGSGPYFAAHETMRNALYGLGRTLLDAYETRAGAMDIDGDSFLDEGNAVREICQRALDHDLVVIGHRRNRVRSPSEERRKFVRPSTAELVGTYCPRPLLVVQEKCTTWSSAVIMLASGHTDSSWLSACIKMLKSLAIEPELCYVGGYPGEDEPPDLHARLAGNDRSIADVPFNLVSAEGPDFWWSFEADRDPATLLVVPVAREAEAPITACLVDPDALIRYLQAPAMLFWPEEFAGREVMNSCGSASKSVN